MPVKPEIVLPKGATLIEEDSVVLPKGATLIKEEPVKKKEAGGQESKPYPRSIFQLQSPSEELPQTVKAIDDDLVYNLIEERKYLKEHQYTGQGYGVGGKPIPEEMIREQQGKLADIDNQIKELGLDPDELQGTFGDMPRMKTLGITEGLLMKRDNPEAFERRKAAIKYRSELYNAVKDEFGEAAAKTYINDLAAKQISYTYDETRENTRHVVGEIYARFHDDDKRKKLINEVTKDRMYTYGLNLPGTQEAIANDKRLGTLSEDQVLALQFLEDVDPPTAQSFNRLLSLTPEEIQAHSKNTSFKLGLQLKQKELEDIGLNIQQRAVEEKMKTLLTKKEKEGLTEEEAAEGSRLYGVRQELLQKRDNQNANYPLAVATDADRLMQDFLGARHGTLSKTLLGIGENADDLINFATISSPFRAAKDGRIDDLEKFGDKQLGQLSQYDTKEEELFGRAFLPVVSGPLKEKLDAIRDDKAMSQEQKEDAARAAIFEDNFKNISYIANDKSGKFNFTGKAVLNAVSNVASEIVPQIVASYLTAGGSNAAKIQQLGSLFGNTFAMAYNDYYTDAINRNIAKPNDYAILHTVIEASTELFGNNLEMAKKAFAGTTAGKLLGEATESEINAIAKAGSGKFKNFGEALGKTAKIAEKNARIESFEEFAGAIGGNAIDKYAFNQDVALTDDSLKDFVTTYVGMLPLGFLGLPFQYKNVNQLQKRALYEASGNPAKYFEKLDEQVEAGTMNANDAFQIKQRITDGYEALKELNVTKSDGNLMTDDEKTNYLFNKVVQKDIEKHKKEAPAEQQEQLDEVNDEISRNNEVLVTPAQKQEAVAKLHESKKIDLQEIDKKIESLDPKSENYRTRKSELEQEKESVIKDYDSRLKEERESVPKATMRVAEEESAVPDNQELKKLVTDNIESVQGYSKDALQQVAPEQLPNYFKNISEQAQDPRTAQATIETFGEAIVNKAKEMFPAQAESKESNITPEATELLESIKEGSRPAFLTKKIEKIAADNGIEVTEQSTPDDIINQLIQKKNKGTEVGQRNALADRVTETTSALMPEKTVAQKGKEIADKIRSLKTRKDIAQANIFGIGIGVYDGALEVIATTVEQGANLAQAISEGIKYIKTNSGVDVNEKDFGDHIRAEANIRANGITEFSKWVSKIFDSYNNLEAPIETALKKQLKEIGVSKNIIEAISNKTTLRQAFLDEMEKMKEELIAGFYSPKNQEIVVGDLLGAIAGKDNILLHEAVHAATSLSIWELDQLSKKTPYSKFNKRQKIAYDAYKGLDSFYEKYKNLRKKPGKHYEPYGLTNTKEFIAEFIANPDFRTFLQENENKNQKPTNVFKKIWNYILNLINPSAEAKNKDSRLMENIQRKIDELLKYSKSNLPEVQNRYSKKYRFYEYESLIDQSDLSADEIRQALKDSDLPKKDIQRLEKSISDRGKDFARIIRLLKTPNDYAQANIFGVAIGIYDGAIEVVATAVEQGAALIDAINRGIQYIRDNGGDQLDEESFKKHIEDQVNGIKPKIKVQVGDENVPPAETPPKSTSAEQPDEFDNKAIIGRMMASEKVSESSKKIFEGSGLKYKVRHQEEARQLANEVVDEYGTNAALVMAEAGRFHGDVNSMIFAVSLDRTFQEEQDATDPGDKQAAAERWADIALRYQDAAESGGRFISAINDFYKKSPAGLVIKVEKEFQRRQDEYFEGREKPTKEAWEQFVNTVEGKELLEEEIEKRKPKLFTENTKKKIKNFFNKFRIDPKDQAGLYLVPPQILNAAIDIIEQAVLAGVSIGKAIEQGIDYISEHHKEAWKVNEFRKDIKDGFKAQKVEKNLTEEDKKKILDKWRKKVRGLTEEQKQELLKKSFLHLIDHGALDYDDFKKLYASVVGLPEMTPELSAKLVDLANKMNEPDKLKEEILKTKSKDLIDKYKKAVHDSEKAATDLNELIGKEKWWFNTAVSIMRLNTLGVTSLIGNVVGNLFNLPFRFMVNLTGMGLDYLLAGAQLTSDKIFGTTLYKSRPTPAIFTTQKRFFRGLAIGTWQALGNFISGMTSRDYFQKEVKQNLRPLESAKKLWKGLTRQEKISLNEAINAAIEAFPLGGMSAEVIARTLNIGDKGFRYAAEYMAAEKIAQQKGLAGIDKEIFILFPDEESEKKIKEAGEAIVFQQKNIVTKAMDRASAAATSVFDDPAWKGVKPAFEILKGIGYTFQPFLNTPLNVAFELFHYMFPPLPLIKAAIAMKNGSREAVAHHLAQAIVGLSVAYAAAQLVLNGFIVASGGDDEEAKERAGIQAYQREGQMNISGVKRWLAGGPAELRDDDVWVDLKYYGIIGMMMLAKGRQYRKATKQQIEEQAVLQDLVGQMGAGWKVGLSEGVFSGTSSVINALSMGGGYTDNLLLGMANVAENTLDPQWLRQFSLASNEYIRDTKGMTLPESAWNQLKQRLFLGGELPAKVNIWGDKIENVPNKQNPYLWYVFAISKTNPFDNDRFGYAMYDYYQQTKDYNIFPPTIRREVNGKPLTPQQYEQFSILVGSHRKQLVAPLFEGNTFTELQAAGHEEVVKYFQRLYNEGRAYAIEEFLQLYPEFQKEE